MARTFIAAIVFSFACLQASVSMALGLGEVELESFLNEPLRARVELLNTGGLHPDQIRIRLAAAEDFQRMGVERAYFLTSISFEAVLEDTGRGYILLTSQDPVLEPYLDFILEARWPAGRLLREYTVLIDPPAFDQESEVISASARVAQQERESVQESESAPTAPVPEPKGKQPLPRGEMPQRNYNAETAEQPSPGSRYMIRRDDTLWEIALKARPEGVAVHQAMLDIQRLNPKAFLGGNINRIKAGYIVYLPNAGELDPEELASAVADVRRQNKDWREGRPSEVRGGPALTISVEQTESGDAESAGDASERGTQAAASALEDRDKAALDRDETQKRLAAMEQKVETLERIVNLKDNQIAALQAALEDKKLADEAALELVDASDDQRSQEVAEAAAREREEAEEAAREQAEATAAAATNTPAVSNEINSGADDAGADGDTGGIVAMIMDNLTYLLAVLLALVIAGRYFLTRRKVNEDNAAENSDDELYAAVELQDHQVEIEHTAEPDYMAEAQQPTRGYGQEKNDEYASDMDAGDALAEADIYIAYGRYPQAIELLKSAAESEPQNSAYRLRLLELFVEMGNREDAVDQYLELQRINDPDSLVTAEKALADLGDVDDLIAAGSQRSADALATGSESPEESFLSEPDFIEQIEAAQQQSRVVDSAVDDVQADDQGLLEGLEELDVGLAEIEIDDALSDDELSDDVLPDIEPSAELSATLEVSRQPNPFDEGSNSLSDASLENDTVVGGFLGDDFSALEIESQTDVDTGTASDELGLSTDFDRVDDAAEDGEEMIFAPDSDEMSTKLDLARAYMDMGDSDGAKIILQEVATEGSGEQKEEAWELLKRIE